MMILFPTTGLWAILSCGTVFVLNRVAITIESYMKVQHAKKVVAESPGPVDFAIGLVNLVLNLPDGQVEVFGGIQITEEL